MVRFTRRAEDADRDPGPRAAGDRYANRETAAGLFSRPPPPPSAAAPLRPQPDAEDPFRPPALRHEHLAPPPSRNRLEHQAPPPFRSAPPHHAPPHHAPPHHAPLHPAPPDLEGESEPSLSLRPLRTPAPAVTTIRVEPVPIDGFEFETAAPWCTEPPPAEPPRPPVPRPAPRPIFEPLAPRPEPRTINWLDE